MTLSNGRTILAIPGPSIVPDRVLRAMHRAAPNIYDGELVDMMPTITADLKAVAGTQHQVAMYIANGHGAWEAACSNVFSRGDKVLALSTGRFALGWADMASMLGVEVEIMDFGTTAALDPTRVEERLRADTEGQIKGVLTVHVDTSTSVKSDVAAVRAAMDAAGHPALLLADCIASLACDPFEMDAWGVDVMLAACQKGLMTPPGMSFVFFGPKADEVHKTADCLTHYWNWDRRVTPEGLYHYFDGTAPTHHLYGLREALDMIDEEGLPQIFERHRRLSGAVWAAAEIWGADGPLKLNVAEPAHRSWAVTMLHLGGSDAARLRDWTDRAAGVTLGIALSQDDSSGPGPDASFRIGHMGHLNSHMVLGTLGAIDAGLKSIGIPHGSGALEAASKALAD